MSQRTSAEVINATLLEVFIAFVFVVLSVAWFATKSADEARAEADSARVQVDSARTAVARAQTERDSFKLIGPFAPPCEPNAHPRELITVTLGSPGSMDVVVNRTAFAYGEGQEFSVTVEAFRDSFSRVWGDSKKRVCRYTARVIDTPSLPKRDFKRGLSQVQAIFYTYGELK